MTLRALQLEDFDEAKVAFAVSDTGGGSPDPDRLAAFDEGYAAGWEDAETAVATEQDQATNAMRSKLQDLSFTFHEARAHVMRSLNPLLQAVVEQAVPKILHDTLGSRLTAEIDDMARGLDEPNIELLVAPGHSAAADTLLEGITALPFAVAEDDTLQPGEMHMRMGTNQREIDLNALQSTMRDALEALDTLNKESLSHG